MPRTDDIPVPLRHEVRRRRLTARLGAALDARVTLVAVDELHNLNTATRAGAEASDTLKYFTERIPATFSTRESAWTAPDCCPAPAGNRSPAGSASSAPARSARTSSGPR